MTDASETYEKNPLKQYQCLVGCDANLHVNKLGVMIVHRGVEKELSWRLAGYYVRCDDTPALEEWENETHM